jgi:L-ascorbate metabolism protein UlaG (beta-lactamase superfamily)
LADLIPKKSDPEESSPAHGHRPARLAAARAAARDDPLTVEKPVYRNLDGSGPHPPSAVFRWAVLDRLRGRRRHSPGAVVVPFAQTDPALVREPPARGQPARLTWLGHASWLVQLDGLSLLIDPIFGRRISYVVPRVAPVPLAPKDLPRIDATLVTHGHYDHYDRPSVLAARARVVLGSGLAPELKLPRTELSWWQSASLSETVRVTFVPSQHWHRRTLFDTNHALWGGFVVEGSASRVYHAGDTAYFGGFAEIGRRHPGLDAALLPIGAYDPAWFMEKQHMNPEQAVQAYADLGALRFFAMHWGTYKLTDEPLLEPPERLRVDWARRALPEGALRILAVGETQSL